MKKFTWLILSLSITLAACSPSDKQSTQSTTDSISQKASTKNNEKQYNEKWDIIQIAMTNQRFPVEEMLKKEKDWQERMANAQTNADVLKVFHEQIAHFRERENVLAAKQMKSERGKAIQQQMLQNFRDIQNVLEKIVKLDFNDPNSEIVLQQLQQEIQQYSKDTVQIMQTWVVFAKEHHFDIQKEHKELFEQKMQELQKP